MMVVTKRADTGCLVNKPILRGPGHDWPGAHRRRPGGEIKEEPGEYTAEKPKGGSG
jgi:hypothetical protein